MTVTDEDAEELVGGRAKDSAEFLHQINERRRRKKHGHVGYTMPHLSSFLKTLLAWLLLSVGALFLWLRHVRMLPPSLLRALPDEYSSNYYVGAVMASAGSVLRVPALATATPTDKSNRLRNICLFVRLASRYEAS